MPRFPLRSSSMALLVLLAGCSSTPLGQQLGESFGAQTPASAKAQSEPPAEPAPQDDRSQVSTVAAAEPEAAAEPAPAQPSDLAPAADSIPKPAVEVPEKRSSAPALVQPRDPLPYRVVLKLPAADPSAPAEAVTNARRAAGLPFEVETIERVQESPADER